jgi:hypothetical protein
MILILQAKIIIPLQPAPLTPPWQWQHCPAKHQHTCAKHPENRLIRGGVDANRNAQGHGEKGKKALVGSPAHIGPSRRAMLSSSSSVFCA